MIASNILILDFSNFSWKQLDGLLCCSQPTCQLLGRYEDFNLSPLSAAYMHRWIGSALVQVMACCLFGTKQIPEPIGLLGTNFSKIWIGILSFSFKEMCLNMSSAKLRPFCPGGDGLISNLTTVRLFEISVLLWDTGSAHRILPWHMRGVWWIYLKMCLVCIFIYNQWNHYLYSSLFSTQMLKILQNHDGTV